MTLFHSARVGFILFFLCACLGLGLLNPGAASAEASKTSTTPIGCCFWETNHPEDPTPHDLDQFKTECTNYCAQFEKAPYNGRCVPIEKTHIEDRFTQMSPDISSVVQANQCTHFIWNGHSFKNASLVARTCLDKAKCLKTWTSNGCSGMPPHRIDEFAVDLSKDCKAGNYTPPKQISFQQTWAATSIANPERNVGRTTVIFTVNKDCETSIKYPSCHFKPEEPLFPDTAVTNANRCFIEGNYARCAPPTGASASNPYIEEICCPRAVAVGDKVELQLGYVKCAGELGNCFCPAINCDGAAGKVGSACKGLFGNPNIGITRNRVDYQPANFAPNCTRENKLVPLYCCVPSEKRAAVYDENGVWKDSEVDCKDPNPAPLPPSEDNLPPG